MSKAWTDVVNTTIDGESPVTEGLIGKFYDNQECLISTNIDTRFDEVSDVTTSASWVLAAQKEIFIPPQVNTNGGNVTFVVKIEVKVAGGCVGQWRARLGSGTYANSATFTNTTYASSGVTIISADVKANADSEVILNIELNRTNGTGTVYARCYIGSSRLERAA